MSHGVTWAVPLGGAALGSFAITQSIQYYLIARVYRSGDLAATASAVDDAWRAVWFGQEQVKDNHLVPAQKEHS